MAAPTELAEGMVSGVGRASLIGERFRGGCKGSPDCQRLAREDSDIILVCEAMDSEDIARHHGSPYLGPSRNHLDILHIAR